MKTFTLQFFALSILFAAISAAPTRGADHERVASKTANDKDSSAEKYTLRYRFRPNEEVRSRVAQLTTIETTVAGTTEKTEMVSRSTKLWRITDVDPAGNITFEHLVENVDMITRMAGRQEVRYDSQTDKTPNPAYVPVAQSLDKVLSVVTIDPSGAEVKREQRHHQTASDNSGALLVMPLPKEPVAIGYVWNLPTDVTVNLEDGTTKTIKTRQRYELEKVADGIATIAVETQILTPIANPKIEAQLIQRLTKGHVRFDIAAGRIVSQRTDLDENVIGFSTPDSSLHYTGRFTEELAPGAKKLPNAKLELPPEAPVGAGK